MMARVNPDRLLSDLMQLRTFGAQGTGVVRTSYSDADMAAREWLCQRMTDAGLEARVDGVGNVLGRSSQPGPALLIGSHSDTQPRGGWLDGALGVIYGLEIARALSEDVSTRHLAVDPVSWIDEESTYLGCLGSRSFCGVLTEALERDSVNEQGETVREAIARVGLEGVERTRLERSRYIGYLEAHIEQGSCLEETGKVIGVVTSIVGIVNRHVRFRGQSNHAGTTPMSRRRDAGAALFDFAVRVRQRFQVLAGPTTVWTIGEASISPGSKSIIPGAAEMMLQFRDPDSSRLTLMGDAVSALAEEMNAEGPVEISEQTAHVAVAPTTMDADLQEQIARAAQQHVPDAWMQMPSAAGHDPMVISEHLPCAMLFVPSIGGISHDFAEDSLHEDIVTGCRVLADAAASILLSARESA